MIYGFFKNTSKNDPCCPLVLHFWAMRVGGRIILSIISEDRICGIRHCSKALRWQERVKDSHGPDLQDILRYIPSIPFPSN